MMLLTIDFPTKRLWLCPRPCRERVNEISHQQTLPLVKDLPADILKNLPKAVNSTSKDGLISKDDYMVITIAAETSRISIHSEGEPTSFFNLLASIGGLFGLFMGLSFITVFECIESYYIILSQGFGTFRHAFKSCIRFTKKLFTFKTSPEIIEEEELDAAELLG